MIRGGLLRRTGYLLGMHISPPTAKTLEAYNRLITRDPEIVHVTDSDGESHSMSWDDYKLLREQQRESKTAGESRFKVRMKGVKAEGVKLFYMRTQFRNVPIDEAEANARFLTNRPYAQIMLALIKEAKTKAIGLGMNPATLRMAGYTNTAENKIDKTIIFKSKGFYAQHMIHTYTIDAWFYEDHRAPEQFARRDKFMRWRYGGRRKVELGEHLDVPALGLDGL